MFVSITFTMISLTTMEKGLAMMMSSQKQKRTRSCTKRYLNKGFPAGCVCNEIFVIPTVVDCGHTFCRFCISEMTRKKPECPICRKYICIDHTKHVESWGWTFTLWQVQVAHIPVAGNQNETRQLIGGRTSN
jgi:hypothetical protein